MLNGHQTFHKKRKVIWMTIMLFLTLGQISVFAAERNDLILANTADGTISVYINDIQGNNQNFQRLAPDYPAGSNAAFVGVGYFNGDRLPDLVVVNPDVPQLVFFLGKKHGPFVAVPGTYPLDVALGPNVAVGDLNNDNADDVVVGLQDGTVQVLLGDGNLADNATDHFTALPRTFIGSRANAVAVADFNEDLNLDAVVCDYSGNSAVVMMGDGSGNLLPSQTLATGDLPESVAIADFNNDAHADFTVAGGTSQYTSVYLGGGDGSFQPEIQVTTRNGGDGTYNVATGDLNNDGYDDLLTRGGPDNLGQNYLSVQLWNPATTNFEEAGRVVSNAWFVGMSVDDFNKDRNQDVIFTNAPIDNTFLVYYGDGAGNLQPGLLPVPTGNLPGSIAVVDLSPSMWKNVN